MKKPSTWFVVAASIVLATNTVMAFLGTHRVGSTWDEGSLVYKLNSYFESGWHTAAPIINGEPDPNFYFGTYVYGPVGQIIPHLVNVVLGNDRFLQSAGTTSDAYSGRHIGVVIWGLLGLTAVLLTLRLLLNSWRWGIVGAAILSSIPAWTGHAMFNIKDTPAATGYTIFTLGLVALVHNSYFRSAKVRLMAFMGLTLGLTIAIGTRTGLALPLIVSLPLFVLLASLFDKAANSQGQVTFRGIRRFLEGFVAYPVAYLLLLLVYPKAYLRPIEVGIESLLESASYPVNEAQLVAGTWMTQPVHWMYLPTWLWAQAPLLVSACTLLLLALFLAQVIRVLVIRQPNNYQWLAPESLPVLGQLFLVPLGVIISGSVLYNATRQLHFVQPALAISATLAVAWIYARLTSRATLQPWASRLWLALVTAGITVPTLAQIQLFPYGYVYLNGLVAMNPVDGNWPTDYWRASGPELMRNLPSGGRESCGFDQLMKDRLVPCTDQAMFAPYLDQRGIDAETVELKPSEYWFVRENQGFVDLPPGCTEFASVTRNMFWQQITIGQIAVCDDRIDQGTINMADPMSSSAR